MTEKLLDEEKKSSADPEEMKEPRVARFANSLLLIAVVFFLFGSGYRLGEYRAQKNKVSGKTAEYTFQPTSAQNSSPLDLSLMWGVLSQLRNKYVYQERIEPQKLVYGAIKGMVDSLEDPYTFFLTPEENEQSKEGLGGRYEGIGAQLGLRDYRIVIVAPLKNSPAEAAGVRAGDWIVAVDEKPTKGWNLQQAVNKIRGEEGTTVKLTLSRDSDEPFDVNIKRQRIQVESVELEFRTHPLCTQNCAKAAYIKVSQFGDNTNREWDKAVSSIVAAWQKKEIQGMILDLRSNPGGYLESSVYLAEEFIPTDKLVVRQEYADKSGQDYRVKRTGRLLSIPLVVLIDEGSASASEILAGALKDHKRARIVGQKSFGKGSVQEAIDLGEGAGLHVTIAKWILPGGQWINSTGVTPDTVIENSVTEGYTLTDETDKQLQRAFEDVVR